VIQIDRIKIKAFRGIPSLELPIHGKNIIIFGENGTGKSSIVDAMEYFFCGKISSFEKTRSITFREHAYHMNHSLDDLLVEVTFKPNNIVLKRQSSLNPSFPDSMKDYYNESKNGNFVLHRSQILEFINCMPSERYRAISQLIGLSKLDQIEVEFKRYNDELKTEYSDYKSKIYESFLRISTFFNTDINTLDQAFSYLSDLCAELLTGDYSINSIDDLGSYNIDSINRSGILNSNLNKFQETEKIINNYMIKIKEIAQKFSKIKDEASGVENNLINLKNILLNGQKYIRETSENICPLCRQPILREKLIETIDSRIKTLEFLSEEISKKENLKMQIINLLNSIRYEIKQIEQIKEIDNRFIKEVLAKIEKSVKLFETNEDIKELTRFLDIKLQLDPFFRKNIESLKSQITKLKISNDTAKIYDLYSKITSFKMEAERIIEFRKKILHIEEKLKISDLLYSTFIKVRKNEIQNIFNSLETELLSFYSILHPNDEIELIRLEIDETQRASLKMVVKFHNSVADPRAHLSEGHLDSLGLCIFLAFRRKFNPNCNLLVLDDIVTTIDANHRSKICSLLFKEFYNYQFIITTHDNVWFEQIKAYQRANNVANNFINYSITNWTIDLGPIIQPSKSRWEKIQDKLSVGDKTGAANDARSYLEYLLKRFCKLIKAKVIYKEKYTVNDLLPPVKKKLISIASSNANFKQRIEHSFQELENNLFLSNLLSHDNPDYMNISINEINEFCDCVRKLNEIIMCPTCKKELKYDSQFLYCDNNGCSNPFSSR